MKKFRVSPQSRSRRVMASSKGNEVLYDDIVDKFERVLVNEAGGYTADHVLNNLGHRFQGEYVDIDSLISDILYEWVESVRMDGLSSEELADASHYIYSEGYDQLSQALL